MAVATAGDLAELLGSLIGTAATIGIEIVTDQAQQQCTQNGASNVLSIAQSYNPQKFAYLPAIAITKHNLMSANGDITKIIRQGVVIKTTDTGDLFYIGGISKYWYTSSGIIVFQGGAILNAVRFGANIRDALVSSGIVIVPLQVSRPYGTWYNPPLFKGCSGTNPNPVINALESIGNAFLNLLNKAFSPTVLMYSYAPIIRLMASGLTSADIFYTSRGHLVLTPGFMDILKGISSSYPYIYIGAIPGSQAYYPNPNVYFIAMNNKCIKNVSSDRDCNIPASFIHIDEMDIGSPIYTSFSCNPTNGSCSEYGLLGLAYQPSELNIPFTNIQLVQFFIAKSVNSVGFMNGYTTQDIQDLANSLGIGNIFNQLLDAYNKMKKAIASLSAVYPMFIAIASALAIVWTDVEYDQGLQQAEQKAKELQDLYNKVVSQLVGNPPPATNRYLYNQWLMYKINVENCARQIIGENPDITYDELINEVQNCASLLEFIP